MLNIAGTHSCGTKEGRDCEEIKELEEQAYALILEGKKVEGERLLMVVASDGCSFPLLSLFDQKIFGLIHP